MTLPKTTMDPTEFWPMVLLMSSSIQTEWEEEGGKGLFGVPKAGSERFLLFAMIRQDQESKLSWAVFISLRRKDFSDFF